MQRVVQVLLPFIIFLRARWRRSSSGREISAMKETERNIIAGRERRKTRLLLEEVMFRRLVVTNVLFPQRPFSASRGGADGEKQCE